MFAVARQGSRPYSSEWLPNALDAALPRTVKDARLETRAARERLAEQHEPYWRAISPGAAVGYRKAPKGGRLHADAA